MKILKEWYLWVIVILLFIVIFLTFILFSQTTKKGCEFFSGYWASTQNRCIKKDCFSNGDCGYRANPGVWCDTLDIGDSIDSVYFKLGEPSVIDEYGHYTWPDDKVSNNKITAKVENGALTALSCS